MGAILKIFNRGVRDVSQLPKKNRDFFFMALSHLCLLSHSFSLFLMILNWQDDSRKKNTEIVLSLKVSL